MMAAQRLPNNYASRTRHAAEYAHRLQERRTLYGTNTNRQRPRFEIPEYPKYSFPDPTPEEEAFVDALYEAAQPAHVFPRDAEQPRAYKPDERVALFFNGHTHTARIAALFEFGGRLRCQLEFDEHGRFALTESQVKRLEVSTCTAIVPFAPQGTALLVV